MTAEGAESVGLVAATRAASARLRRTTADFGMWIFLATETLFFGVLFFLYLTARMRFPDAFAAASRETNLWLGTVNTALLLTSSYTMALAVDAARIGKRVPAAAFLRATALLGVLFLGIKAAEYRHDYFAHLVPGAAFAFTPSLAAGAQIFFWLYFVATGFHALHLTIGVILVAAIATRLKGGRAPVAHALAVEMTGLYWHFVDIVWIFLFPCLYLVARA